MDSSSGPGLDAIRAIGRDLSSVFLAPSKSDSPPLRVGLLVRSTDLPAFFWRIFQDLVAATFVQVALVIVDRRGLTSPGTVDGGRQAWATNTFLRYFDTRHRPRPDPLAPVDASAALSPVPHCSIDTDELGAAAAELQSAGLDVVIDFTLRGAPLALDGVARHGCWSFEPGRAVDWPTSYLPELVNGDAANGLRLVRRRASTGETIELASLHAAVAAVMSASENRFAPIWCGVFLPVRALRALHEGEFGIDAQPASAVPPRGTVGSARLVGWMARETLRRGLRRLRPRPRQFEWRVGIRRRHGTDPSVAAIPGLANLTWLDAPPGCFLADPILVERDGQTWLFVEQYSYALSRGLLACGRIDSTGQLVDVANCLERPFHLSHPLVFEAGGEMFMVPESSDGGSVDLLRASRFPYEWRFERTLLPFRAVDSVVFERDRRWWMFTTVLPVPGRNDSIPTLLFSAPDLQSDWILHPSSPISSDARVARGAGPAFFDGSHWIRPSQDCGASYGRRLLFNQIEVLDERRYAERTIRVIEPDIAAGMSGVHTYSRTARWEALDGYFDIGRAS